MAYLELFSPEKKIVHDDSGNFGIQKLLFIWEKPNKFQYQYDKFEIHFSNFQGQIQDKDYFVSFLVSNIDSVKKMS